MSVLTSPGNGVEARLANATPNQSLVGTLRRACARALNVCILDTLIGCSWLWTQLVDATPNL
jgi:hypothetical protein